MVSPRLIHEILLQTAIATPEHVAVRHKNEGLTYGQLWQQVERFAGTLCGIGLAPGERVAVYLPKQFETVVTIFGAAAAGGVFVPINPLLKPQQVSHILKDCSVRILVTSGERAMQLADSLEMCRDLSNVILISKPGELPELLATKVIPWDALLAHPSAPLHRRIDGDMTAILYTSGSTGHPKGVVLSHRNMVAGAESVAEYLENHPDDHLLAALPFSFDYGLSQLTTAFSVGASAVLMDYLLPRDVIRTVVREQITGLAAVPPLWNQLAALDWPPEAAATLRYITNSGGAMRRSTLERLRAALPETRCFLMYGLTEAFRSTYLPPEDVDERPDSIGMAIPNAEVMVVREDGSECAPGEPGELVHRGALVALGYWNDAERTAERFRAAPGQPQGIQTPEVAVWSGDQVRRDSDGYLYFVSRKDEMIKTSGYRVSPTEVEEVIFGSGLADEAVAVGAPHPDIGQAIVLFLVPSGGKGSGDGGVSESQVLQFCQRALPSYMVPARIELRHDLPRNANGKIDRAGLATESKNFFCT